MTRVRQLESDGFLTSTRARARAGLCWYEGTLYKQGFSDLIAYVSPEALLGLPAVRLHPRFAFFAGQTAVILALISPALKVYLRGD